MDDMNSATDRLDDFLKRIGVRPNACHKDFDIRALSQNSNSCKRGDLFIAVKGAKFHGIEFFKDAKAQGVKFCLTSKISEDYPKAEQIYIADLESRLLEICKAFYQDIEIPNVIAVTGTNGKSSIIDLIYQIAAHLNISCNSLGTLGFKSEHNQSITSNLTSPDIFAFYNYLNIASRKGVEIFAFEASSHGLSQNRIGSVKLDMAVFTNLSLDHLDYHHNMEDYYQAKKLLFTKHLKDNGNVIINIDDPYGMRLRDELGGSNIYGISQKFDADITFKILTDNSIKLKIINHEIIINHDFIAHFQIINYITAIAYFVLGHNIQLDLFPNLASHLKPIKGRMQVFEVEQKQAKVIIDFAHTPDALENVLQSLKAITPNRLIAIFGCGGDRDKSKRAIMGKIANELADVAIVTDDNPRNEDPAIIRADIMHGNDGLMEIDGRADAILFALGSIKTGDILVILGKGHEEYQIIKNKKYDFSESEIVTNYLAEHYGHN